MISRGNEKIGILLPSLDGGGAERSMVDLALGLQALGYQVDLVLVKAEGPYLERAEASLNVVDLGCRCVAFGVPALLRYLRHRRPTVMLSSLDHTNLLAGTAVMLSMVGTRLVLSIRNNPEKIQDGRFLKAKRLLKLTSFFFARADAVHAVSEGVADSAAEVFSLPRERIDVVYNPVVTPEMLDLALQPFDDRTVGFQPKEFIVAAGRLVAQKDFLTLIRAFALVRRQLDIGLVILGEGEKRLELEAEVSRLGLESYVRLPGFVENPFPIFRNAGLFVLSSMFEGLPGVLIQAMAVGAPVVSTDCPYGPSEILEGGKWGRLVPVGDAEFLAESIVATLREKQPPDVTSRAQAFSRFSAVQGYLRLLIPQASDVASETSSWATR